MISAEEVSRWRAGLTRIVARNVFFLGLCGSCVGVRGVVRPGGGRACLRLSGHGLAIGVPVRMLVG